MMAKKKENNHFDSIFQFVTGFIEERLRVGERIEDAKRNVIETLYTFKRNMMKTVVESTLLLTGILALIAGGILVLKDYFQLKYILLAYGVIVTILVLLRTRLNL